MSYSYSRPYKEFLISIDQILQTLRKSKLKRNNGLEISFKEYILASAVFLAHAELENYIQDIFDLYLRNLSDKKSSEIHHALKIFLVYKFMRKNEIYLSVLKKDEKSVFKYIDTELKSSSKHIFDKDLNIHMLKGAEVYEELKYPSSRNLMKIYNRLGCTDIFNQVSREISKDSKSILEQIGTYRTSLAHNASLIGVSADDIIICLNDLKIFTKGLDRVLYKHIVSNYKQVFWYSNIS